MVANRWGMHAPNAGFHRMDDFYACGFQNYTVLNNNANLIPIIRSKYPNARILVRAYTPDWHSLDPRAWADQIATWANPMQALGIELTWANEQNLRSEGHPDGADIGRNFPPRSLYEAINIWNLQVIQRLRQVVPWATLHYPAFASGHSDDQADAGYVGLEICRPSIEASDVLDCHGYWDPDSGPLTIFSPRGGGQRFVLARNRFPDKPIFISEAGDFAIDDPRTPPQYSQWIYSLYNYDYVLGATFFIWDSDAANQVNIIQRNGNLVAALKNAPKDAPLIPPAVERLRPAPTPPITVSPPSTPPGQPPPLGGNIYVVQSGDTLSQIALKFGVTTAALIALNQIADPRLIRAGQRITIPLAAGAGPLAGGVTGPPPQGGSNAASGNSSATPSAPMFYVIQPGDTLSKIAHQFNIEISTLAQANNISDPNQIRAGTKLTIPMRA